MAIERYYLDTSIWLDHYLKRGDNGEAALLLILKIIAEDSIIIFSNFIERELKDLDFSSSEINHFLSLVKPDHLKKVSVTKEQLGEGRRLAHQRQVPFGDAIHALVARDHEACLVSRDHDFESLKDITRAHTPEELLNA